MIEDIQALRQAARLTPDNENQDEKVWCIAAGNVNLIDEPIKQLLLSIL